MKTAIQDATPEKSLMMIARRLALIDAAGCRGIEGEVEPGEMFAAIVDAASEAQQELQSLQSPADERAIVARKIRDASGAVTVEALSGIVWEDADIDELVDDTARTSVTAAYRSPDLQKSNTDELVSNLLRTLEPQAKVQLQDLLDRLYSRFLLAGDVGFELGFGAAQSLGTGRPR